MVRQSSPAKGHRTGHYATNALSGSNWNSHKAQGIGGKNERGNSLRHALAVRHIPLCCPDEAVPVSLRGHVWAADLTRLAPAAQTPLQRPLQQVVT